ncbi:MAG TPA: hypothetical protein VIC84_17045 [Blastocatellia bacterium]|jgi:hypothetical protein
MQYDEIDSISRSEAMVALGSGNPRDICKALVRLAFHDPDWEWVQSLCIELAEHSTVEVQLTAILCLGHLARIHRALDLEKVAPLLIALRKNPLLSGRVDDAMNDIEIFLGVKVDRALGSN